ncbi:polymerase [Pseudomonas taiwanensis]|uniref:polymerase n=1 Tax=Pseudomonas taiwanensis TaxID=470150 RepID=UPI0004081DC4|nr:polymerase [Pseudomonas taiwanensis]
MYILTRVDRSILQNTLLFFAYFCVITWVNNSYIFSLYEYMGAAEKTVDFGFFVYLVFLALICALLCGREVRRPGDLLVTLLVVILVPHALVLTGGNAFSPSANPWSGVALAVALGILTIGVANKLRFRPVEITQQKNQGRRVLLLLAWINLLVLAFICAKSANYFSFDFSGQYFRRAIAREVFAAGSSNGYLSSIGTQAFFPVLFAWGVYKRKWFYLALGLANVLVLWGAFGQKYPFIVLALIYALMAYFRRFGQVKVALIVGALLGLLLMGVIEQEVLGYSYLNDYLLRRAFIVPSTLLGAVDQFVSLFGPNYYRDTLLGVLFGEGKAETLTFRLGSEIFENPEMNANVNFFAIAYMQMGYLGVMVESLFVASIVVLMNFLFSRYGAFLAVPVSLLFATKILEQSLLTVLLGSGVCMMVLFLVFISLPLSIFGRTRT